jgi:hypothetical protein
MVSSLRYPAIAILVFLLVSDLGVAWVNSDEGLQKEGVLQAKTIWTVTSPADAGPGTLREALAGAGNSDIISFDAAVFLPSMPATIHLSSSLPDISQGGLTVDGSAAGVILEGGNLVGDAVGLRVVSAGNTIRGLEILDFPGGGMLLSSIAAENTVEGNVISLNGGSCGLEILGSRNIVAGNFIGTDATGTMEMGNSGNGISIADSSGNCIGPGNLIAHNGGAGIKVSGAGATGNTITHNSVTANFSEGIRLEGGGNGGLSAPIITVCTDTSISGTAPPDCVIEVFSDDDAEGKAYEGATTSNGTGTFSFTKPAGFAGPYMTATATDSAGSTSPFSPAASVATEPATWSKIKAVFGD